MIGIFIWTMIFLFTGIFIGYAIGSYLEMQKQEEPRDNERCCRCDSRHTNADRIRNMSDEELADWIYHHNTKFSSEKQWIDWLQSEAE